MPLESIVHKTSRMIGPESDDSNAYKLLEQEQMAKHYRLATQQSERLSKQTGKLSDESASCPERHS
ncbi:hypothetical protein PGTUg99_022301 [Puccinia graminis f. sp. tritici]|uniref:Uncharacterized protein n=1 Tax=Puccinia graminis f. sp. tritici TaxID=56615 RepID=A0A5B0M925_PUCGR|nr:hypothetical protein PGTUg99_022301 [Puccinia graminis f. sp. tritici]